MTNNEAAKWIQLYIDLAKIDPTTGEAAYLNDDDKKTIEAMEMAINALTAQPEERTDECTETRACVYISRQAAIDLVEGLESARLKCKIDLLYPKVVKGLIGLPSAQPESARINDCNGCKFIGCYDTDFPCANCVRKDKDYYEPEG